MRLIFLFLTALCANWAAAGGIAPGAPGIAFPWATSEKQGVGTAYESYDSIGNYSNDSSTAPISKIWFTIARGVLTEVFYPRVDLAQTRDTQFVVTDGKTLFWEEQYHTNHEVRRLPGAPFYTIVNREPNGRFTIEKEIWADPDSNTIIQKVRIRNFTEGLHFYLVHKPAANNSLFGDSATAAPPIAGEGSDWQALRSTMPFKQISVGYVGNSDGYTDLSQHRAMTWNFEEAPTGNVAITAEIEMPSVPSIQEFSLFLVMGSSKQEVSERYQSVASLDVEKSREKYLSQWQGYLQSLSLPLKDSDSARRRDLAGASALVIKVSEDKTYAGSIVASLSNPWGEKSFEHPGSTGPWRNPSYHVVWPRDLYHTAMGLLAAGDTATAKAVFYRLLQIQFRQDSGMWEFGPRRRAKDGSFPQNFWADGRTVYGGYQADETAMPVILAYNLWKRQVINASEAWQLVERGAQFLHGMGPWTQTERWEETYGVSPNSTAYVISALLVASELASAMGKTDLASTWQNAADSWATKRGDNVDDWTFTTKGRLTAPFGNGKYYLRMAGSEIDKATGNFIWDALWDPNRDGWIKLANFSGEEAFRRETEVVDPSFLALVRLGVRSPKHPQILGTLGVIDAILKTDTPKGPGWHRYRFDGYGEERRGRIWPLLTGERLHFELALRGNAGDGFEKETAEFEAFANPQGLFAEQVWDDGPLSGMQNGSACPLTWGHAEHLEWLRSRLDGKVFEEVPLVKQRYGKSSK